MVSGSASTMPSNSSIPLPYLLSSTTSRPAVFSSRDLRNQFIRLPGPDDGYARVMLVGPTGAGKTTLLRQLIGSDHKRDRFPSTSTARTTTAEIEIVTTDAPFRATVTFMTQAEARGLVDECVMAACVSAVEGQDDAAIADAFLEHGEQRFRLSYVLGAWRQDAPGDEGTDPIDLEYESPDDTEQYGGEEIQGCEVVGGDDVLEEQQGSGGVPREDSGDFERDSEPGSRPRAAVSTPSRIRMIGRNGAMTLRSAL